jgi:hypothetical protein
MPEISRFLGIIIYMYYKDHSPPHFHAEYNEYSITVEIETGVVEGRFPKRALSAILEWLDIHKNDLKTDWQLAIDRMPLNKIAPLE